MATEKIHIHLSNKDQTEIFNQKGSSDQTVKYIILDNDKLRAREKKLIVKLNSIQDEKKQLENELESVEKKHQYNKSLLKNFHEMNKKYTTVFDMKKKIITKKNKYLVDYKKKLSKDIMKVEIGSFIMLIISFFFLSFFNTFFLILFIVPVVTGIEIKMKQMTFPELKEDKKQIENKLIEINEIYKNQDYIHEYIELL